jgi:hypothetical protein
MQQIDGLSLKSGPTESGKVPAFKVRINGFTEAVGGELIPANFWVALPKYFILLLILLPPLAFLLYKKRGLAFNLLSRLFLR